MQASISFIPLCEAVKIDVWIKIKFALDTSLYGHSIISCFIYVIVKQNSGRTYEHDLPILPTFKELTTMNSSNVKG